MSPVFLSILLLFIEAGTQYLFRTSDYTVLALAPWTPEKPCRGSCNGTWNKTAVLIQKNRYLVDPRVFLIGSHMPSLQDDKHSLSPKFKLSLQVVHFSPNTLFLCYVELQQILQLLWLKHLLL